MLPRGQPKRKYTRTRGAGQGPLSEGGGGGERTRTADVLRAKQVLSQLSYAPTVGWWALVDSNHPPLPYQGSALTN